MAPHPSLAKFGLPAAFGEIFTGEVVISRILCGSESETTHLSARSRLVPEYLLQAHAGRLRLDRRPIGPPYAASTRPGTNCSLVAVPIVPNALRAAPDAPNPVSTGKAGQLTVASPILVAAYQRNTLGAGHEIHLTQGENILLSVTKLHGVCHQPLVLR